MNKFRSIFALATLTLILALGATGHSQENQTDSPADTPELKWMYGSVAQVAFAKGFILVFSDQGYSTFTVTDKTVISIGPKKVGLEAIKTEDSVRVQYYCSEPKKCVAVSISESKKENE
jgi:hypothetical protein